MYFATDLDNRQIINDNGESFTADEFKEIVQNAAANDVFYDMTMMTSRFIQLGYDWEKLEEHLDEA